MVIPDFLTVTANSLNSSIFGILIPFFQSVIMLDVLPVDIPVSLDI